MKGAGFPALAGWYATIAAPYVQGNSDVDVQGNSDVAPWVDRFTKKYGHAPEAYSITSYDAILVILDAIERAAASGKPVTRDAVHDAIQTSHVSVFQCVHDPKCPADDVSHQFKYLGVALQIAKRPTACPPPDANATGPRGPSQVGCASSLALRARLAQNLRATITLAHRGR